MTDLFDIFCVCSPERFFDYRCTEVRPVRSRKWPGAVLVPGHATAHFHTFPTSKACLMFGLDFDECTLIWLSIQMYTVDLQVESVELPLKLGCFVKTHHMIHMISPLCKDRRAWANSWVWLDSKQQLSEEILSREILFIFSVSMSRRAGPTGCPHMFKHICMHSTCHVAIWDQFFIPRWLHRLLHRLQHRLLHRLHRKDGNGPGVIRET